MSHVAAITIIADVSSFAATVSVAHCSDYVQVTVHGWPGTQVYSREVRKVVATVNPAQRPAVIAEHVREVSNLVGVATLVSWLKDSGFVLNQ